MCCKKSFQSLIAELLKIDLKVPSAKNFKGSQWFKLLEEVMIEIEPQISLTFSRLYEDSKKARAYLSINAKCIFCYAKYSIKMENNPRVEDKALKFKVKRNKVHNKDFLFRAYKNLPK